jgi:glycosyltransferase involved in cell wall biosynthesis
MISVVIPTYNDENVIASTIDNLRKNAYTGLLKEIIVVDAGSSDKTISEAEKTGATVVRSSTRNRSALLNLGAERAKAKILYFIFPGSLPPKNFTNEIVRATQHGYSAGTFRFKFDYNHWLLSGLSAVTKVKRNFTRLEDQSMFVLQELFVKAGSFREDLFLLEDQEIIARLKRYSSFILLKDKIVASTKKYIPHGIVRTEASYFIARFMFLMGCPQERLLKVYNWMLGEKTVSTKRQALRPSLTN